MNKKKYIIAIVIVVCVIVSVFAFFSTSKRNNTNQLMNDLEKAINTHSITNLVNLYPDFCRDDVSKHLSQEQLDRFYDNVVKKDKIDINILKQSSLELSEAKRLQDDINKKYHSQIALQDYQLITIEYHEDFGESTLSVVKIEGEYFLYADAYFGEPIQYFVN